MFGVAVTLVGVLSCVLMAPVKVTGCDRTRDGSAEWESVEEFDHESLTEWQTVDAPPGLKDVPPQLFLPFLDAYSQIYVARAFTRYKTPVLDILTDRFDGSKEIMQEYPDTVRVLGGRYGSVGPYERRFDESTPRIMLFTPDVCVFTDFKINPPSVDHWWDRQLTHPAIQFQFDEKHPNGVLLRRMDKGSLLAQAIFNVFVDCQKPYKGWVQWSKEFFY